MASPRFSAHVEEGTGHTVLYFPRYSSCTGRVLQTFVTLVFTSYFFFLPLGLLLSLSVVYLELLSLHSLCALTVAYLASLFLWRPQYVNGWPRVSRWLFYKSPLMGYILNYHNSTW